MSGKRIKKLRRMLNAVIKDAGDPYTETQKKRMWTRCKKIPFIKQITHGD